jgi:hypothetical protein
MTAEEYRDAAKSNETSLLRDIRASVRAIDGKVEEILDVLKEHLPETGGSGNGWSEREFYGHDAYEAD